MPKPTFRHWAKTTHDAPVEQAGQKRRTEVQDKAAKHDRIQQRRGIALDLAALLSSELNRTVLFDLYRMLAIKIGANAPSAIADNADRYQKPDRPGLENTGEENDQCNGIEQRSHQAIVEAQLHLGNILLLFLLAMSTIASLRLALRR